MVKPSDKESNIHRINGKTITYTPQYYVSKPGMYLSGAFLSFQKIEDEKYIYMHFVLFGASELNDAIIETMNFTFKDGTKLDLPCKYNFTAILYPSADRADHAMRAKVTEEQLNLFTTKPLISAGITFANGKSFDSAVTEKRTNGIAQRAIFFQTGEKVKDKELEKRFESGETKAIQDDANWDF